MGIKVVSIGVLLLLSQHFAWAASPPAKTFLIATDHSRIPTQQPQTLDVAILETDFAQRTARVHSNVTITRNHMRYFPARGPFQTGYLTTTSFLRGTVIESSGDPAAFLINARYQLIHVQSGDAKLWSTEAATFQKVSETELLVSTPAGDLYIFTANGQHQKVYDAQVYGKLYSTIGGPVQDIAVMNLTSLQPLVARIAVLGRLGSLRIYSFNGNTSPAPVLELAHQFSNYDETSRLVAHGNSMALIYTDRKNPRIPLQKQVGFEVTLGGQPSLQLGYEFEVGRAPVRGGFGFNPGRPLELLVATPAPGGGIRTWYRSDDNYVGYEPDGTKVHESLGIFQMSQIQLWAGAGRLPALDTFVDFPAPLLSVRPKAALRRKSPDPQDLVDWQNLLAKEQRQNSIPKPLSHHPRISEFIAWVDRTFVFRSYILDYLSPEILKKYGLRRQGLFLVIDGAQNPDQVLVLSDFLSDLTAAVSQRCQDALNKK